MVVGLRFRVMAIALILAPSARCRHGVWGASVDDEGGPEGRPTMDTSAANPVAYLHGDLRRDSSLRPSWQL